MSSALGNGARKTHGSVHNDRRSEASLVVGVVRRSMAGEVVGQTHRA